MYGRFAYKHWVIFGQIVLHIWESGAPEWRTYLSLFILEVAFYKNSNLVGGFNLSEKY